jgi:hypothetical protein
MPRRLAVALLIPILTVARDASGPGSTWMRHPTVLFLTLAGLADGLAPKGAARRTVFD